MGKEIVDKIESVLKELATQLGTTVEYLWTIMVTQSVILGVSHALVWLTTTLFVFILIKKFIKFYERTTLNDRRQDDGEEMFTVAGTIILAIVTVLLTLFFIGGTATTITKIFNPEFWALEQIMDKL